MSGTKSGTVRVLIADDEAHIRALINQVMVSMKCDVVAEAKNGKEAVEMFDAAKPHLVLLDINMPVMDGKEALKAIKAKNPGVVVIMLTSLSAMDIVKECLEAGAENYIRKDTPLAELKKNIAETWGKCAKPRGT